MAKFIVVTLIVGSEQEQQAINIEASTRYLPVAANGEHSERTRIFLMGPAAREDRFVCAHTFQELQAMIDKAFAS